MTCNVCKANNDAGRKFCNLCGAPLGILCPRCRALNPIGDKHCGECGVPLEEPRHDEVNPADGKRTPRISDRGQYTAEEIDDLLRLSRKMKSEEDATESLDQDDIDSLFGRSQR